MSIRRTMLKTVCALSTVMAVCAGSVAFMAPAFAATRTSDTVTGGAVTGGTATGGGEASDRGNTSEDGNDGTGKDDTGTGTDPLATYTNVTLRWGMNDETNSAAYYGGCNFLSAGKAGNTGSAKVWTQELYKSTDGNVSIEKPDSSGRWVNASWDSRCLTRGGDAVTMGKRADGRSINTESQVVVTNGSGIMAADGSITISWKGSWTVAYYGGMTYWSVTDPTLTLDANGIGALTATASGYGSSMSDASKWVELSPRTIHVADITGVDLSQADSDHGFTVTPEYLGVAVTASGDHGGQAAKDDGNAEYWGSFPQSFVDFQLETGQSAYWYTAGSTRDFAKITLPMSVQFDSSYTVDVPEESPASTPSTGGTSSATTSNAAGGSTSNSDTTSSGSTSGSTDTTTSTTSGTASGLAGTSSGKAAAAPKASTSQGDTQRNHDADTAAKVADGSGDSSSDSDSAAASSASTESLIEDNARTIAAGSAGVAAATALPLGCGWLIRRRLGLDPSDALDRLLAGR
ncbi:hypothetical protein [Bifidobacterium callimiconis]|uniref:Cell surface protein n=1 Tax=Bifidobacterium callimiconis TaxID=2306973 RepID=A0A430FEB4_9BIFI|nr:hypothetical protein [Bifidobacterium callimiconis]RSX51118.1 hypothetical protein D2E23_0963 [Bifidobacterium callimiconis]